MENVRRAQDLIGNEIYDRDGNRIGRVGNVYVDDSTHQPEWVTVRTGMFGAREHFVPLEGASAERNRISVGVSKDKVRDAPQVDAEQGHLSDTEGQNLYQHYGLQPRGMAQPGTAQPGKEQPSTPSDTTSSMTSDTTGAESSATAGTAGMTEEESSSEHPTGRHARTRGESTTASTTGAESATSTTESGMTGRQRTSAESTSTTRQREGSTRTRTGRAEHWGTGERRAPQSMVRYEERLRVDTETVETGRVRLRCRCPSASIVVAGRVY